MWFSVCSSEWGVSPHGIFCPCVRWEMGLARTTKLSARRRRRRRRQLVSPGGYRPPDPPPCLISKGAGLQNVRSHTRMLGPSVFPDSNTPNLTKSEQKHTFSKNGHVQKIQKCQFLEKKPPEAQRQRQPGAFQKIPCLKTYLHKMSSFVNEFEKVTFSRKWCD